jgi:hypothetical protein
MQVRRNGCLRRALGWVYLGWAAANAACVATEAASVPAAGDAAPSGSHLAVPADLRRGVERATAIGANLFVLDALSIVDGESEHPTEMHVFASRMADVPIYVTTGRGRWKVRAYNIDFLGKP